MNKLETSAFNNKGYQQVGGGFRNEQTVPLAYARQANMNARGAWSTDELLEDTWITPMTIGLFTLVSIALYMFFMRNA